MEKLVIPHKVFWQKGILGCYFTCAYWLCLTEHCRFGVDGCVVAQWRLTTGFVCLVKTVGKMFLAFPCIFTRVCCSVNTNDRICLLSSG